MFSTHLSDKISVRHLQGSASLLNCGRVQEAECQFAANIRPIQAIFSHQSVLQLQRLTIGYRRLAMFGFLHVHVALALEFKESHHVFHRVTVQTKEFTIINDTVTVTSAITTGITAANSTRPDSFM